MSVNKEKKKIQANLGCQGCEALGGLVSFLLKMSIDAQVSILKFIVDNLITHLYKQEVYLYLLFSPY